MVKDFATNDFTSYTILLRIFPNLIYIQKYHFGHCSITITKKYLKNLHRDNYVTSKFDKKGAIVQYPLQLTECVFNQL